MDNIEAVELVVVIGALFAVALLLDMVRRMRRRRYEQIAVSKRARKAASKGEGMFGEQLEDDALLNNGEVGFGRSRVVGVRDESDVDRLGEQLKQQNKERNTLSSFREPAQAALALADNTEPNAPPRQSQQPDAWSAASEPQMVIMHLLASRGATIAGANLRDALLDSGLRYGEMKIFHYYQAVGEHGDDELLFSLANAVNPGSFELREIDQLQTPGVTLFLNLNQVSAPIAALDSMLAVVDQLAAALSLQVFDESRSSMTRQTIDHCRQRARGVAAQRERAES